MLDGDDLEGGERGSLWPFGAALAVFALVVIAVAVFTFTRDDGLTDEQRVGRAAVGQNDALQRQDYADYQRYTCARRKALKLTSLLRNGIRRVSTAPGTSTTSPASRSTTTERPRPWPTTSRRTPNSKRTTELTFVRQDGQWKVCSGYS